ncbi:MAG: hypothetical protein H0V69_10525 [Acidimicrobiia bacterium]|nr:hypothetical protein [Acidimicrobiia bacterium]
MNNAHRRHRREARRRLAAAEQVLGAATTNLEAIEATAGGPRDRYNDLRSRHETARRMVMSRSILDRWGDHENRAEQLEQLLDALDTWTRWARGHDVATNRLKAGADTIDTHARLSKQFDLRDGAATVHRWAAQAGIELAYPTTIERDQRAGPRREGLDLGLGR